MIKRDLDSLTALGRSLTSARDSGIIAPAQFAQSARALVTAMVTGSMEMEAYAGIHWVMGQMLEAAFASPARAKRENLDEHVEAVGRMWNYVGPSGEPMASVDKFFSRAFDMEKARFLKNPRFTAPLSVPMSQVPALLRASGLVMHEKVGDLPETATHAALGDEGSSTDAPHLIIGWGDKRMALSFGDPPAK